MVERNGPAPALAWTCDGCCHLSVRPQDRGFSEEFCLHPLALPGAIAAGYRGDAPVTTPAWCPEISAARLAFGRALMGEARPAKKDDRWFGGFIAALATLARYPAGMTAKSVMQEHGVTVADLRESEQGTPQEIDAIEASR